MTFFTNHVPPYQFVNSRTQELKKCEQLLVVQIDPFGVIKNLNVFKWNQQIINICQA